MPDHTPDLQALLLHEATVEDEACDSKAHEASPPMPCPFCGVAPSVEHRRTGWRIACNNDNCPTRPDGFSYETRGEAVEAWNTPLAASIREAEERGAAREREECARLAQDAWCLMSTFSIQQSGHYAAACAEVAKVIRARAAADALEDRG